MRNDKYYFRKARENDLPRIMEIIASAQNFLHECGVDQWQNGYPDIDTVLADIRRGNSYVIDDDALGTVATAAIIFDGETTYSSIRQGAWLNDNPYAVVHRMAVDGNCRRTGLASLMMNCAERLCTERRLNDMRIDTHRDNHAMQTMLARTGYCYCGTILLRDGSERLAYQKILRQTNPTQSK